MNRLTGKRGTGGFTLLELIIIILLLGILAAIAIPAFINFNEDAKAAVETADVRSVTVGVSDYYVQSILLKRTPLYPAVLDSAGAGDASSANPFFGNVLTTAIPGNGWSKLNATDYRGHSGTVYHYNNVNGKFQ